MSQQLQKSINSVKLVMLVKQKHVTHVTIEEVGMNRKLSLGNKFSAGMAASISWCREFQSPQTFRLLAAAGAALCLASARPALGENLVAGGGSITNYTLDGTYYTAHIFTNVGTSTFAVTNGGTVEVLVVGGGGGGGGRHSGGGGAGGLISTSSFEVVTGSNYVVTVGDGGAGYPNGDSAANGSPGYDSVFGSLTAYGGGYGAGYAPGGSGGSGGGGGGFTSYLGGAATNDQGFVGGAGGAGATGGGGGGAGGAGIDGGDGGIGVTNNMTGNWAWYAGGGGGGSWYGPTNGLGGASIGGNGGLQPSSIVATDGRANTGSGGGGGGGGGGLGAGGKGGSGIVIVRYASTPVIIQNNDAANIVIDAADLVGTLNAPSEIYQVLAYWGTVDGTNNEGGLWQDSASVGWYTNQVLVLTNHVASLASATLYYYTFCAVNGALTNWATPSASFMTRSLPSVANTGATNQTYTSATLRGTLTDGQAATAWICWGTSDGGTGQPGDWNHVVSIGSVAQGIEFSTVASGLSPGATYCYRCYASNEVGTAWSATATSFNSKPVTRIRADGGSITNYTLDGTYYTAHVFTNVGTSSFSVTDGGIVEVLVVGGGGGGGDRTGGAGGAGGLIYTSSFEVESGSNYVVTVGDGGVHSYYGGPASTGSNSVFGSLTAYGGGYGTAVYPGGPGGSGGGGAGFTALLGGAATNGQGFAGGAGAGGNGGGGGGAGGAGVDGGDGGIGVTNNMSGVWAWYAGGGGGGSWFGPTNGLGGSSIGGNGGLQPSSIAATDGRANTGSGGGGGSGNGDVGYGGNGGSGIVIVRYPTILVPKGTLIRFW
jgi:hypothetical protein